MHLIVYLECIAIFIRIPYLQDNPVGKSFYIICKDVEKCQPFTAYLNAEPVYLNKNQLCTANILLGTFASV